jgi:hypothetical protein
MLEGGKRLIVRGLVREIEQYFRLGYAAKTDLKLVAWSDEAVTLAWFPGEEVPTNLIECRNSANGEALIRLISGKVDDRFVVFTDGFWADESRSAIRYWKDNLGRDALRIVKVGADANPKLKGSDVFEAEDLFAALDGWSEKW